ncbi:MAG: bifunctional tetrahydrofolate synthase/dihydrofolate synthase [Pseudomonadota bacterium]|nr:bifunctional tetrahydrofolate synthase/dihydrofolate synthase [Pseudomonadota bacterium]
MTVVTEPSLGDWLERLNALDPTRIELGLTRVRPVAEALGVLNPQAQVVTVAGTNGKGSTLALAESIALADGRRVGCYTSPHILRFNERVRVNGQDASDADIVAGLEAVESARGETPLTYFEFITLAALWQFQQQALDCWLLEIGLGGRLDVVNVVDPDVSVITSIGLDHMDWLGPDRDAIAVEKAGILRAGRPVICGESEPPATLDARLRAHDGRVWRADDESLHWTEGTPWSLRVANTRWTGLPAPGVAGVCGRRNAAVAIAALLATGRPPSDAAVRAGLAAARIPGRLQVIAQTPETLVDTAHNGQAAAFLAQSLAARPLAAGRMQCVLSMLADKDPGAVVSEFLRHWPAERPVDWLFVDSPGPRGQRAATIRDRAEMDGRCYSSLGGALDAARRAAGSAGRVVCFGSFLTVEAALRHARD